MSIVSRLLRGSAVVAFLLALQAGWPMAAAAENTKVVIMTDWLPEGSHAGLFLARHNGWFKAAGLDVDVLDGKGSGTTIQQLAAGQIDIALAQLAAMASAVSGGLPVISVMGLVRDGSNGVIYPAASGWKTFADLKGKRIGVTASGGSAQFLDAFFDAVGAKRSDYIIVNVEGAAVFSSYVSGLVDAMVGDAGNFIPSTEDAKPSKAIMYGDVGLRVPGYGLIVRRDSLTKDAAMIRKFVAVQQKTWNYIFAGHEQEAADAILAERSDLRLNGKQMVNQIKLYMQHFDTPATKGKPIGWQAKSDWEHTIDVMVHVKLMKPGFKPVDFYTNQFVPG